LIKTESLGKIFYKIREFIINLQQLEKLEDEKEIIKKIFFIRDNFIKPKSKTQIKIPEKLQLKILGILEGQTSDDKYILIIKPIDIFKQSKEKIIEELKSDSFMRLNII
jgi:hypothetical protein